MANHSTLKNPRKIQDIEQEFATSGVYIIWNSETDTYYIGQSQVVIRRLIDHFNSLADGTHGNSTFQREYEKFGKDVFVVDLLYDMPNSSEMERARQESREIQRYKTYHRRLYNRTDYMTVKTKESIPAPTHPSTRVSDNDNVQNTKHTEPYRPEYSTEPPDMTDMGTCVDCGMHGVMYVQVFECDDKRKRCGQCVEKMLSNWRINFNERDQYQFDRRSSQAYFRWQTTERQHIKEQLSMALNRFVAKHNQLPDKIFASKKYNGPETFDGIEIRIRNITPSGCLDIPIMGKSV